MSMGLCFEDRRILFLSLSACLSRTLIGRDVPEVEKSQQQLSGSRGLASLLYFVLRRDSFPVIVRNGRGVCL